MTRLMADCGVRTQGGLTLMVLGATAATARHLLSIAAEAARRRMFVRMEVDSRDDAYRHVRARSAAAGSVAAPPG